MAYTSEQKIHFDDVDGAGIVYYPRFFHLCHAAFEDLFDTRGPASYPTLIVEQRRGFPTVHIESDFHAPLRYGDAARVHLVVDEIGRSSVKTRYTIERARDGVTSFTATVTTVLIDLDSGRPLPIEEPLRSFFEGLKEPARPA